jgi:hypothetical protein
MTGSDADLEETVVYPKKVPSEAPPSGVQASLDEKSGRSEGEDDDFETLVSSRALSPKQPESPTIEGERLSVLLGIYEDRAEQLLQEPDADLPPPAEATKLPRNAASAVGTGAARRLNVAIDIDWQRVRAVAKRLFVALGASAAEVRDVVNFGFTQRDREPVVWIGLCALWGAFCSVATTLMLTR